MPVNSILPEADRTCYKKMAKFSLAPNQQSDCLLMYSHLGGWLGGKSENDHYILFVNLNNNYISEQWFTFCHLLG